MAHSAAIACASETGGAQLYRLLCSLYQNFLFMRSAVGHASSGNGNRPINAFRSDGGGAACAQKYTDAGFSARKITYKIFFSMYFMVFHALMAAIETSHLALPVSAKAALHARKSMRMQGPHACKMA